MMQAFEHYGIDWTARKYQGGRAATGGWCKFCYRHSVANPYPSCDLEQARAAEMEELGFPARICFHCRKAHPVMFSEAALCPACKQAQDLRDAKVDRRSRRRSSVHGWSMRVPDGAGCSEHIPTWMVDWDGNPNG